ncbi:MAG: hypothetical protein K8E66_05190, partial [Phycisphaerales bacterium]|nr:hypothetical protein [Phycisphaerales bacterium]
IPELPLGSNRGKDGIVATGSPGETADAGWWINPDTGDVRANAPDTDLTKDGAKLNEIVGGLVKG